MFCPRALHMASSWRWVAISICPIQGPVCQKSGLGHSYHWCLPPEDRYLGLSGIEASRKRALCSQKCLLNGKGVRGLGCKGRGVRLTPWRSGQMNWGPRDIANVVTWSQC